MDDNQLIIHFQDIWNYEMNCIEINDNPLSDNYLRQLSEIMQKFIIQHEKEKYLFSDFNEWDDWHKNNYRSKFDAIDKASSISKLLTLGYFEFDSDIYEYRTRLNQLDIVLKKEEYLFLYVLMLRQYERNIIHLEEFFLFQFAIRFLREFETYSQFFKVLFIQYGPILNSGVKARLEQLLNDLDSNNSYIIEYFKRKSFESSINKVLLKELLMEIPQTEIQEMNVVLKPVKIKDFLACEDRLYQHGFIDDRKQWIKPRNKNLIITFYCILISKLIIRKFHNNDKPVKLVEYRDFFQKRYSIKSFHYFKTAFIKRYGEKQYIDELFFL
jgi:hypothetical protein